MGFLTLLLAISVQAAPQEKHTLVHSFKKGEGYGVSWKMGLKMATKLDGEEQPVVDIKLRASGSLELDEVEADGAARGRLVLRHWGMSGRAQGKDVDVLVEDGQVKRPEGFPEERVKAMVSPIRVKISRTGVLEPETGHPLSTMFRGKGSMFGPTLPDGPVGVGDTWEGVMQTGQAQTRGGAEFKVKYLLAALEEKDGRKGARVTLDEKHELKVQGIDLRFQVKADALFDRARGRYLRFTLSNEGTGTGEQGGQKLDLTMGATIEFESADLKK